MYACYYVRQSNIWNLNPQSTVYNQGWGSGDVGVFDHLCWYISFSIYSHIFFLVFLLRGFSHNFSDSNQSYDQRWHLAGSIVGPMLTSDLGPVLFYSSDGLNRERLVRCWPNTLNPTIPAYTNVMPILLFQVSGLTNVGPTWFQVNCLLKFMKKNHSPYLCHCV